MRSGNLCVSLEELAKSQNKLLLNLERKTKWANEGDNRKAKDIDEMLFFFMMF
jgi:hypothetical protein